jgi:hypothetical protein
MIDPFPSVLALFPACSQSRSAGFAAVPSVPSLPSVYVRIVRSRAKYTTNGEPGNSGNTAANEKISRGT